MVTEMLSSLNDQQELVESYIEIQMCDKACLTQAQEKEEKAVEHWLIDKWSALVNAHHEQTRIMQHAPKAVSTDSVDAPRLMTNMNRDDAYAILDAQKREEREAIKKARRETRTLVATRNKAAILKRGLAPRRTKHASMQSGSTAENTRVNNLLTKAVETE